MLENDGKFLHACVLHRTAGSVANFCTDPPGADGAEGVPFLFRYWRVCGMHIHGWSIEEAREMAVEPRDSFYRCPASERTLH